MFEFAYLLFNVFSHFDAFLYLVPISFSTFPKYISNEIKFTGSTPHVHFISGQKMEKISTALAELLNFSSRIDEITLV